MMVMMFVYKHAGLYLNTRRTMSTSNNSLNASPVLAPSQAQFSEDGGCKKGHTVVIKIGSSSLSSADGTVNIMTVCALVEVACALRQRGHRVILTTSGAVSIGSMCLGLDARPTEIATKKAVAAVGQCRLMRLYDDFFSLKGQPVAQVLLSRNNIGEKGHYYHALSTFRELLRLGVVPIVNENDTVNIDELRVGDNDTLAGLVASLVQAEWLFLLTDVDGVYTADPRSNPEARRLDVVPNVDDLKIDLGDAGSCWGTGGMATKIQAARIATMAGTCTVITLAKDPSSILRVMDGENVGTRFLPSANPVRGHKKWIAHGLSPTGSIVLDNGAVNAVKLKKSLFAAGIVSVEGDFTDNSSITLFDLEGQEIGIGLTNYSSADLDQIKGKGSSEYRDILGYHGPEEVIHRHNLVLRSFHTSSSELDLQSLSRDAESKANAPADST